MAYPAWISHTDNLATTATVTTTTAASGYPATNMQALPITSTWRSTAMSDGILIDLTTARSIDIVALVNHNFILTSGGATVYAGNDPSFPASPLLFAEYTGSMTLRDFLVFVYIASPVAYRYWYIDILGTDIPDRYIEVGYLVVGISTLPTFGVRQGWTSSPDFINQEHESVYAVPFVSEMHRKQRLSMQFGPLTRTEMDVLRDAYIDAEKDITPVLLVPERTGADAYFGRFTSAFEEVVGSQRSVSVTFEEDGYGKRIHSYQEYVLNSSPSLYLRLGEVTGTRAKDSSGNALDGTYTNSPSLGLPGPLMNNSSSKAAGFNKGVQYVTVPDDSLLDPGDTFTLLFWFRWSTTGAQFILDKGANGYAVYQSSGQITLSKSGVSDIAQSSISASVNTWAFVAVTKATSTRKIYMNGVDVTSLGSNATIAATTSALFIGRLSDGSNPLDGALSEIAIFPTALGATVIQDIFEAGRGLFI